MSDEGRAIIEYAIVLVSFYSPIVQHHMQPTTRGELFLQRKLRTRFDLLKLDLQSLVTTKQATQKKHHHQQWRLRQFSTGQLVMASILKRNGYQESFKANQDQFCIRLNSKMERLDCKKAG